MNKIWKSGNSHLQVQRNAHLEEILDQCLFPKMMGCFPMIKIFNRIYLNLKPIFKFIPSCTNLHGKTSKTKENGAIQNNPVYYEPVCIFELSSLAASQQRKQKRCTVYNCITQHLSFSPIIQDSFGYFFLHNMLLNMLIANKIPTKLV